MLLLEERIPLIKRTACFDDDIDLAFLMLLLDCCYFSIERLLIVGRILKLRVTCGMLLMCRVSTVLPAIALLTMPSFHSLKTIKRNEYV